MIKRSLAFVFFYSQSILAGTFFNVTSSGPSAQLQLSVCLNGAGPLSCQLYTVSGTNLNIISNIPNHTYPNAGIKILTPGYTPAGCTMNKNGYCLFSVNNTQAVPIPLTPSTCTPGLITFSPTATQVNNPTGGSPNPSQQFTIYMTMCNSLGQPLLPSTTNPLHIDVYGAPTGVISPTSTTSSTGAVTLTYSGQSFPNNILINAWISDSSNNGAALGQTQVLKLNTPTCSLAPTSYQVSFQQTLPNALQINADVGYSTSAPTTTLKTFTIDTGSLGVVVPVSELPNNGTVIGPGAAGVKYYDSSGNTYSGNYYLAPVRIQLSNSSVIETQPIMVLGINKAYCTGPSTKACYSNPPSPTLHYMGVGFNRNSTTTNDLFNSPAANAFLHITNTNNGTDVTPGYYLSPNASSGFQGLTLGISSIYGYTTIDLTSNTSVPGDFNAQAGCFTFPNSPLPNQFCGTALLDVGIDSMFIDLPKAKWPAGTFDSNNNVPAGINMSILMGSTSSPALSYSFTAVQSNPPAGTATPSIVQWIDTTSSGMIFVNTGRRPLYLYNYLYNGQCGKVGFNPV